MPTLQLPRTWNIGNVLVVVGVVALGLSFWLPRATAARMHRVEEQAELYARRLCEEAQAMPRLDFENPQAQGKLLERIGGDRLKLEDTPGQLSGKAFLFSSKHYYFMVTRTPQDQHGAETPPAVVPDLEPAPGIGWRWPWRFAETEKPLPFEVYAWPATLIGPGVAVFFHPSDAEPAFCRNLDHTYHGLRRHPLPGKGRKQFEGRIRRGMLKWYRGFDDARWLLPRSDDDV
ncbi:MAG: hypothetical protein ACYS5W_08640 [Planctomycetota bacterium]|jgi:hypothetical protein